MTDIAGAPILKSADIDAAVDHAVRPAGVGLMAPDQNVQRIMRTGTVWFAAAVAGIALVMGPLLASGWRPSQLPLVLESIWWLGSVGVAASLGLIGWSGCPVLEVDVPTASRNKSRTMQIGTATLIIAGTFCLFAVVAGPAA